MTTSFKKIIVPNENFFAHVIELLNEGKDVDIRIRGHSMRPFLREGDVATLSPASRTDVSQGDVVLAKYLNKYVLHRVLKTSCNRVVLIGDGNLLQKEEVSVSDIYGIIIHVVRINKTIDATSNKIKMLAYLWYLLRPVRYIVYRMKRIF